MKNIELTEEQKVKLLEMCKTLFPEYKKIKIKQGVSCGDNYFIIYETRKIVSLGNCCSGYSKGIHFEIHWFEFCMIHLSDKIFINDEDLNMFLLTFNIENNLIDCLYNEFLKL